MSSSTAKGPRRTPEAEPSPGNLEIVRRVFEHRLRQQDLDQILGLLSKTERDVLIQEIGSLLQRISALVEVSNEVSSSLSLDVLLPRLMEIVSEALTAERSTLFLYDRETNELFSRVAQGDSVGEIRFPSHLGIAGSVFAKGEPEIIADAYADSRFNPEVDRKTGFRTRNILCAPLHNKEANVIGVTQVLNKRQGDFHSEDLALLEALTSQAASGLENARLFELVERARHEEEQLLDITSAVASELQLDALLAKVISAATQLLEADRSTLFIHDRKTGELWSRIAEGLGSKEIRFPETAGIAGACFTSGEPINIPDAYEDPRFNREVDRKSGYRTKSLLCMPIRNKDGRKLGVIQVLNRKGGPFGRVDEQRLRAFTAQVAIALENAQLFTDVLNERNYNESILKSLNDAVITLDADRRVITANEAAVRILRWDRDRVLHRPVSEVFANDENQWILQSLERVGDTGRPDITMDADVRLDSGEQISANLAVVPLIDVDEEPIGSMLIFEDITSEKRVKSTMSRYMAKEVIDRLLEEGAETLGGTAQVASVLFSDIRRFTTIAEELGARDTVSMLNDYFSLMVDEIDQQGGILDKYIGDAIMAVFGAPFTSPEDADNALRVANGMLRKLAGFNAERAARGQPALHIGVGVSTGELIVGNIGSPKRMDYTVIGDTVNLAARLESATKYYGVGVLFSELTAERLTGDVRRRELDLIRVKGKTRPVAVFEGVDHHTPETFPNMEATLAAFDRGLRCYRKREWKRAIACFEDALGLNGADGPSRLYLERCRHYLESPPPEDWGGVWTMTEK